MNEKNDGGDAEDAEDVEQIHEFNMLPANSPKVEDDHHRTKTPDQGDDNK